MYTCAYCKQTCDKSNFHTGNDTCKTCILKFKAERIAKSREKARRHEMEQQGILAVIRQFQSNNEPYVYLISSGNKHKIGYSTNVDRRIRAFNTASPIPCKILAVAPGGKQLESELHRQFKDKYVSGEWFLFEKKEIPAKVFASLTGSMVFLPGYISEQSPSQPCV